MKTVLLSTLLMLAISSIFGWEDAYVRYYIPISPDSSFITVQGGYMEISTAEIFEKVKTIDSAFRFEKWPRCLFNFHIGRCNIVEEMKIRNFIEANHIRAGAIGCKSVDGSMEILPVWNPPKKKNPSDTDYSLDEKEFRYVFSEANSDSNHYFQTKERWAENKRKSEEWNKSAEGMEFKDSLNHINSDCRKKHKDSEMDCVETKIFEFDARWKARRAHKK